MTEPTDQELEALAVEHEAFGFGLADKRGLSTHGFDPDGLRSFARAVLAKWGTPPAAAGEPVAWQYQSGDGLWHSFIDARHYKNTVDSGEWPIRALYATPQPTQAQAGAVPPRPAEIERIIKAAYALISANNGAEHSNAALEMAEALSNENFLRHFRHEQARGIKGGQHG